MVRWRVRILEKHQVHHLIFGRTGAKRRIVDYGLPRVEKFQASIEFGGVVDLLRRMLWRILVAAIGTGRTLLVRARS